MTQIGRQMAQSGLGHGALFKVSKMLLVSVSFLGSIEDVTSAKPQAFGREASCSAARRAKGHIASAD